MRHDSHQSGLAFATCVQAHPVYIQVTALMYDRLEAQTLAKSPKILDFAK